MKEYLFCLQEVYSPGFIKGLHERYGIKQRSLERKIREEEARKKYHEDENKKMYEDVSTCYYSR